MECSSKYLCMNDLFNQFKTMCKCIRMSIKLIFCLFYLIIINHAPLQDFAGLCGALMIVGGVVGAVIAGIYVDKTKRFEEVVKVSYGFAVIFGVAFFQVPYQILCQLFYIKINKCNSNVIVSSHYYTLCCIVFSEGYTYCNENFGFCY